MFGNFKIVLISISLFMFSAQAKIPPLAYKNISQYFHRDKAEYSPVLGAIALETGLIYNIRFFGPYAPAFKRNAPRKLDQ